MLVNLVKVYCCFIHRIRRYKTKTRQHDWLRNNYIRSETCQTNETEVFCSFFYLDYSMQNWTAEYWVSLGAPRNKLVIGMPTYGRCSILKNPIVSTDIGAFTSGACAKGTYTVTDGFYAYYEVKPWKVLKTYMKSLSTCTSVI